MINLWTKKVLSWQELDPYSSLEEESDIPSSPKAKSKSSSSVPLTPDTLSSEALFLKKEQCSLRPRKHTYTSSRECRTGSDVKFYRDMCDDIHPKKKRNILSTLRGPKNTRLDAQKKIVKKKQGLSVNVKLTQTYNLFQPSMPTENDKPEVSDYDTDATISYDPPVNTTSGLFETDVKPIADSVVVKKETVVKCGIKTHFVGIKCNSKGTKHQKYKCLEEDCDGTYDSVAALNNHFRNSHLPSICEICRLRFNTPSALSCHVYKHRKLEHICEHSGKKFPFASDLKTHMNSHWTVKSFVCVKPKCGKSYFSKGELDKHVKTHSKVLWRCRLCTYTNRDERNLKSHMRVHSGLKKYLCDNCLKLFKYDTQFCRHLPCKLPPFKPGCDSKVEDSWNMRERSPEY